jgi:Ca2+-binding RTX toxin-like protein
MATITGTGGNDSILPSGVSAGVTGGLPAGDGDVINGTAGNDSGDGGGGFDTLDYSSFVAPITATFTNSTGSIAVIKTSGTDQFSNMEQVIGGIGNDTLNGFDGAAGITFNLIGGLGSDTFNGFGQRSNVVTYGQQTQAVLVDLLAGTANDGNGGSDILINVRRVTGSDGNDTLLGGDFGDVFQLGLLGAHTVDGRGGSDRGNELRMWVTTPVVIDLGTTIASGGGFTDGFALKSNGISDSLTRMSRAVGGTSNDTVLGTPGDDVLQGAGGNDLIIGRSGVDFVGFSASNLGALPTSGVTVHLQNGTATDGWGNTDTLIEIEGVSGTDLADDLTGADLGFWTRSFVQGGLGNDTLRNPGSGFTAADYFFETGAVTVNLGIGSASGPTAGSDSLLGINSARTGSGADNITGSTGDDWLTAANGNDVLAGGDGADRLLGENGNDTITGGNGDDSIVGGNGVDSLTGGAGADRFVFTISTTPGEASSAASPDVITDFSAADGDYLRFSTTADLPVRIFVTADFLPAPLASLTADLVLPAFTQPELFTASPLYWISHTTIGGWVVLDENRDGILQSNEFAVRIASAIADPEVIRLGGSPVVGIAAGDANDSANVLFLGPPGVAATGLGLGGDDTIYGSGSHDAMIGGTGNDVYLVRHFQASIRELADEGYDVAWIEANDFVMGANIEEGRLIGTGTRLNGASTGEALVANAGQASHLLGNAGDDVLWGSGFADTLNGGDGDDILRSQGGADTMLGGLGNDNAVISDVGAQFVEHINGGYDTAWIAVDGWTMGANIEIGRLAAPGAVLLHGAATAENLVANQGAGSTLNGNGGNDVLWGSGFADTLNGGEGDDIMRGQGGNDVMAGGTGNDQYVVFASGATVTEGEAAGYDIVYFVGSGSFGLGAHIEEARLFETATGFSYTGGGIATNKLLVGNNAGLASNIAAGAGNDTVFGTAAADTLNGGTGDDVIYTGGGADRLVYSVGNWGSDQVAVQGGGTVVIQFQASSGIGGMSAISLTYGGGNTSVATSFGSILVFGATLTSGDFIFS